MSWVENSVAIAVGISLFYFFVFNPLLSNSSDYSHSFMLNKHEIVCKSMSQDTCGIGFSNCDNGMTYKCMLNVEMREIKDEKK
jgi:hypothetical protein